MTSPSPLGLSPEQQLQSALAEYWKHLRAMQERARELPDGTMIQLPDGRLVRVETLR